MSLVTEDKLSNFQRPSNHVNNKSKSRKDIDKKDTRVPVPASPHLILKAQSAQPQTSQPDPHSPSTSDEAPGPSRHEDKYRPQGGK